jgi:type I protein arginine methyltransferase
MLADRARNDAYWAALGKHLSPGDLVIDVGAGSGVLSLFAARHGARVHAVEHGPIVKLAEQVARDNGVTSIEFHRSHSQRLELPEQADAIIHEQIGDALFDERVVTNIADLRDRLLKPGGRIHPHLLALYIEPVEVREDLRAPFAWQQELHGLRFEALEPLREKQKPGYLYRSFRPFPFERFLCRPEPVVSVDLLTVRPADLPTEISYERTVESDGILDGYCVYFDAFFDDEIGFTSSPEARATNWANPLLRVAPRPVRAGQALRFSLRARDLAEPRSWEWDWR